MKKGRNVPPLKAGERRQHQPGELRKKFDLITQQNITLIGKKGNEKDGRGLLIIEVDQTRKDTIKNTQFLPVLQLAEISKVVPFGDAQPLNEAIKTYNTDRECVVLVIEVTPHLPNPQMWFDLFPYQVNHNS